MNICVHESLKSLYRCNPKKIFWRYIIIKLSKIKDKEFWKQQLGEKTLFYMKKITLSRFLRRNLVRQERVEWYIQNSERKKLMTKNTTSTGKAVIQKWRRNKDFTQTNKSWGSSSPLYLPHENTWKYKIQW